MSYLIQISTDVPMLDPGRLRVEMMSVEAGTFAQRTISDSAARAIAAGWQSSHDQGCVLAALNAGLPVAPGALLSDIQSVSHSDFNSNGVPKELQHLAAWVNERARNGPEVRVPASPLSGPPPVSGN